MKYLVFVFFCFVSCRVEKSTLNDKMSIEGNWCLLQKGLINEINYGEIHFSRGGVLTLSSRADTIFLYQYNYNKDYLEIIRTANHDVVNVSILNLSEDTLVLGSLLEKSGKQIYFRCKRDSPPIIFN